RTARDVRRALTAVRRRLEEMPSFERVWRLPDWIISHRDHPLVATATRRLIWEILGATEIRLAAWHPERTTLVDITGAPLAPAAAARVRLWHPVRSDTETVTAWRQWINQVGGVQPFAQVRRTVFRPAAAERAAIATERFAGFVLYQHQLAALFR